MANHQVTNHRPMPPVPQPALQRIHADSESGIDVWRVDLTEIEHDDPRWLAPLSERERQHMRRYHFARDRLRFGATRATLRWLLGQVTHREAAALQFTENRYGKPALRDGPAFNVSHSDAFALIAIARHGEIGVDIERCNPAIDALELAHYFFSRAERDALRERLDSARTDWFYRIWTVKEASLKAVGLGITEHLASFSVTGTLARPILRVEPAFSGLFGALRVLDLPAPDGYAAALAFTTW